MFVIEDELHADSMGRFPELSLALAELDRLSKIPWMEWPNVPPCGNLEKCGRRYELVDYDDTQTPWIELRRIEIFEITAKGIQWKISIDGVISGARALSDLNYDEIFKE